MGMTNASRVPHGHFKVLIVDSGSKVLQEDLRKALRPPGPVANRTFFIREGMLDSVADDVITVPADQKLIDLIPHMDLVIGRAGFNTISECLAARIPMLLLGEAMNPEMAANIIAMKSRNLASFVDIKTLATDFVGTLETFLAGEFRTIRERVSTHSIGLDGAEVAANEIADLIGVNSNA
jgi:UDP:flavonoid glycosyltransferase YjiC (YdhE family)